MEPTNNTPIAPTPITSVTPPQPPVTPRETLTEMPKQNSHGAIWAIVIILAVVLAGGAYFWGERVGPSASQNSNEELEAISTQSDSDETAEIEADLNATDIENVDYDLNEENFTAS